MHIKPADGKSGNHVYVTDGSWAFDFSGWTREAELLREYAKAYTALDPTWAYERVVVTDDLETICAQNHHRPPAYFPYLPWERAYNYIQNFPSQPPKA